MLVTLDELDNMEDKTHTKTDHNIVNKVWVRVKYRFDTAQAACGTLLYALIDSNYETHLWAVANHATAETFNHWHLTTEIRVQYQANPCEICAGQCGTGAGFSLSNSVFISVPFHQSSVLIYSCITDTV
jgi:hypothetical protein